MTSPERRQPPEALQRRAALVEVALEELLPPCHEREILDQAIAWSLLAGGKRLRPVLVMASAGACGGEEAALVMASCAVECLHTYSLIHDDLPSMDNDALRRGQPTCHVKFGEATAILAGDALQTLAFEIVAGYPHGEEWAHRKLRAAEILAHAAGRAGMVLGQQLDLQATADGAEPTGVDRIHRTKTAALIAASVQMGGVYAGVSRDKLAALGEFGLALGRAFQVVDDLLDVEGETEILGKTVGSDQDAQKATAVAAWGLTGAREQAKLRTDEAYAALAELDSLHCDTSDLRMLTEYVLQRRT